MPVLSLVWPILWDDQDHTHPAVRDGLELREKIKIRQPITDDWRSRGAVNEGDLSRGRCNYLTPGFILRPETLL